MERRLIDANALALELFNKAQDTRKRHTTPDGYLCLPWGVIADGIEQAIQSVDQAPTIDAVEVVRCRECAYFRDKHVLTPDGQRKSYSEFPPEAFRGFDNTYVTCSCGINVGSQCLVDCDSGYGEDKTVFRRPDDYCSRGVRKEPDENAP